LLLRCYRFVLPADVAAACWLLLLAAAELRLLLSVGLLLAQLGA